MSRFNIIVIFWLILLTFTNIYLFTLTRRTPTPKIVNIPLLSSPSPSPSIIPLPSPSPSLSPLPSPSPISTPSPKIITDWQPQNIYLGSANTTKNEWSESTVEIQLNTNDYPNGVTAIFEAQLSIISGEVSARLKNKTTGAIMSITEVTHNSNTATWKSSPKFQLHHGNNIYVIELRSSSSELANLSNARLKLSL